jgi:hypothetical protein
MRKPITALAVLAVLAGTSVGTFAAEGSAPGNTAPAAKGIPNTTAGAGGMAQHSTTSPPIAGTHPPPSAGCGTVTGGMKQGC